jgi:hypothetical protein
MVGEESKDSRSRDELAELDRKAWNLPGPPVAPARPVRDARPASDDRKETGEPTDKPAAA